MTQTLLKTLLPLALFLAIIFLGTNDLQSGIERSAESVAAAITERAE